MVLDEQQRALRDAREVPLLRFQAASGLPYWVFGLITGLVFFLILYVPGLLVLPRAAQADVLGSALFFGTTFAILATFTVPVYRGAADDLRSLGPIIPIPADDLECLALGLTRATARQVSSFALVGLGTGAVHSYMMGHHLLPTAFMVPQVLATVSLWVFMFTTLSKLIINAAVFSQLGSIAEPDLLRPSSQAPFGSAAIRPALFLIGTLCTYSLLLIGDDNPIDNGVWLGVAASLFSLFGIVARPLRGIRERIQARRREIILALDKRLESINARDLGSVSADTLKDLDTILDMRERVAQAPGWPLDLAGIRRILFYIVLPPMTWAAAAVVEMLIEKAV